MPYFAVVSGEVVQCVLADDWKQAALQAIMIEVKARGRERQALVLSAQIAVREHRGELHVCTLEDLRGVTSSLNRVNGQEFRQVCEDLGLDTSQMDFEDEEGSP